MYEEAEQWALPGSGGVVGSGDGTGGGGSLRHAASVEREILQRVV